MKNAPQRRTAKPCPAPRRAKLQQWPNLTDKKGARIQQLLHLAFNDQPDDGRAYSNAAALLLKAAAKLLVREQVAQDRRAEDLGSGAHGACNELRQYIADVVALERENRGDVPPPSQTVEVQVRRFSIPLVGPSAGKAVRS